MIYETIKLTADGATLTPISVAETEDLVGAKRRAVIVCPGGGYKDLSRREAEPIAVKFMGANFATFVLRYSTGEGAKDFAPLKQAALAIKYVREHANEYNVDPDYVFICGFSAGGHLAASAGILWAHDAVKEVIGEENLAISRPTGMILGYPVITAGEWAHRSSFNRLCGKENPTKEELDQFSLELHVSETTPPVFIWHTFADQAVPVQNSLLLADAMTKVGVPFELHIFPEGPHGLALCNEQTAHGEAKYLVPHNECWIDLAIAWARDLEV